MRQINKDWMRLFIAFILVFPGFAIFNANGSVFPNIFGAAWIYLLYWCKRFSIWRRFWSVTCKSYCRLFDA